MTIPCDLAYGMNLRAKHPTNTKMHPTEHESTKENFDLKQGEALMLREDLRMTGKLGNGFGLLHMNINMDLTLACVLLRLTKTAYPMGSMRRARVIIPIIQ